MRRSMVAVAVGCAASKYLMNLMLPVTGLSRSSSLFAGKHAPWGPPAIRGPPIHRGGLGHAYSRFFVIASLSEQTMLLFHEPLLSSDLYLEILFSIYRRKVDTLIGDGGTKNSLFL